MKSNTAKPKHRAALVHASPLKTAAAWLGGITAICLLAAGAMAQTFEGMAFQSYLVDEDSNPITAPDKDIKFSIYDESSGGAVQWAESQKVTVTDGNFSVILGEGTWDDTLGSRKSLASVFDGSERFIEIELNDTKLSPRLRLLPSPYTFHAKNAENAENATTAAKAIKIIQQDGTDLLTSTDTLTTLNKSLKVEGDLTVDGNVLDVDGTIEADSLGVDGKITSNLLHIDTNSEVSLDGGGSLLIGADGSARLRVDRNEIQAVSGTNAGATKECGS
jgi:hypothetical protein